jgi:Flp pilus assembly CpaF family ATPase
MVNRFDQIFVEKRGVGMTLATVQFTSNDQVVHVIRRICAPIGRRINEQTPLVDGRLADGSRVNAVIQPLAVSGPCLTIRKFPKGTMSHHDLIRFGSMTKEMASFLELCVEGAAEHHRQRRHRLGEDHAPERRLELHRRPRAHGHRRGRVGAALPQAHVVTLETRPPNLEGTGAITIRDLVKNCLRMRPDRIVVGECRGGEALDMLQAMNTGHDGSLTTIHSNSPRDCISRLETLVLMAGMDLPSRAIREQVASAVHIIIQQARLHDGTRKVTAISEVTGIESGVVTLQDIFLFQQTGFDEGMLTKQQASIADQASTTLADMFIFIDPQKMFRYNVMAMFVLAGRRLLPHRQPCIHRWRRWWPPTCCRNTTSARCATSASRPWKNSCPMRLLMITGAMSAGASVNIAIESMIKEQRPPIAQEFDLMMRELRIGVDFDTALKNMEKRNPDPRLRAGDFRPAHFAGSRRQPRGNPQLAGRYPAREADHGRQDRQPDGAGQDPGCGDDRPAAAGDVRPDADRTGRHGAAIHHLARMADPDRDRRHGNHGLFLHPKDHRHRCLIPSFPY